MTTYIKNACIWLSLAIYPFTLSAETKFSGFASIVGGVVTNGNQFLADYPNTGVYDSDLSLAPDTTIGLQIKSALNDEAEFVLQILSRGANDFDTSVDWAYLNYQLDAQYSIQAGRKRLPLYFYSDFFDLGLAYNWIRPPSDNYTWQITNYNGLSLNYESDFNDWDMLLNVYIGREDDEDNQLLAFLNPNTKYKETWKNMFGIVAEFTEQVYELRFTIMSSQLDRVKNGVQTSKDVAQLFYGISANAYFDQLSILSEFNNYERPSDNIYVHTYMLSLAYKIDDYIPHITYSNLQQSNSNNTSDENHNTISLGLRKNLSKSAALKIQFDKTEDNGISSEIVGDGELLSFGLDIVF